MSPPPTSASATAEAVRFPTNTGRRISGAPLGIGIATAYLSIIVLIPLALKGVRYRALGAGPLLRRNLLVYGLSGLVVPFVGIKIIDLSLVLLGLA